MTIPVYVYAIGFIMVAYVVLQYTGKLPSVGSIQALADMVNTKGGNILALAFFTLTFFFTGLGLTYWTLNRMLEGKLSADNAIVMTSMQWIMGAAFGGSFSAMLKVMSGEPSQPIVKSEEKTTVSTVVSGDGK